MRKRRQRWQQLGLAVGLLQMGELFLLLLHPTPFASPE